MNEKPQPDTVADVGIPTENAGSNNRFQDKTLLGTKNNLLPAAYG